MNSKLSTAILILLLIVIVGVSSESLSIDCAMCIESAVLNNADLLDESISLEANRRSLQSAWNIYVPDIDLSLGLSGAMNILTDAKLSSSLTPGVSIGYTIKPGVKESINKLRIAMTSAELSYEAVERELREKVESEFYYLLTIESSLDIQKKNIELAERQYEQTRIKYDNGLVSELQVLQAKVNYENLKPAYSTFFSNYQNRLKEFLLVIGIDPQSEVVLSGSLDVDRTSFDASELIDKYLFNRTDIKNQMKQIEMLESSYRESKANGRLPSVTLTAGLNESIAQPFSYAGWQDYSLSPGVAFSLSASLGVNNYLPGGTTDLALKSIKDSITSASLKFDTLRQTAALEIYNLVDSLATCGANLDLSELNLDLSKVSFQMTQKSFEQGTSDRAILEDSQQELLIAEQNLLESKYEYLNSLISLRSALCLSSFDEINRE